MPGRSELEPSGEGHPIRLIDATGHDALGESHKSLALGCVEDDHHACLGIVKAQLHFAQATISYFEPCGRVLIPGRGEAGRGLMVVETDAVNLTVQVSGQAGPSSDQRIECNGSEILPCDTHLRGPQPQFGMFLCGQMAARTGISPISLLCEPYHKHLSRSFPSEKRGYGG